MFEALYHTSVLVQYIAMLCAVRRETKKINHIKARGRHPGLVLQEVDLADL